MSLAPKYWDLLTVMSQGLHSSLFPSGFWNQMECYNAKRSNVRRILGFPLGICRDDLRIPCLLHASAP